MRLIAYRQLYKVLDVKQFPKRPWQIKNKRGATDNKDEGKCRRLKYCYVCFTDFSWIICIASSLIRCKWTVVWLCFICQIISFIAFRMNYVAWLVVAFFPSYDLLVLNWRPEITCHNYSFCLFELRVWRVWKIPSFVTQPNLMHKGFVEKCVLETKTVCCYCSSTWPARPRTPSLASF